MWEQLFQYFENIDDFLWSYVGFPAILFVGLWLSFRSRFAQFRCFPRICKMFVRLLFNKGVLVDESTTRGVHPLTAFFAGLGGSVGIGNVVAITTAVQIGGPGAVFWMWLAAIAGSLVKYGEVFLGIHHRVPNKEGCFTGGPMIFLRKALGTWAGVLFCVLMSLYGVEIFQFTVVASSISSCTGFDKVPVAIGLIGLVILAELGGVRRIGNICTAVIPLFIVLYLGMGAYVLLSNLEQIPAMCTTILSCAFTPHAAVGSFAGTSVLVAISQGVRRGCYSSDIGIGYASIIHSATRMKNPSHQGALVIFEVFIDTFIICTMSVFLVLLTGTWKQDLEPMHLVEAALANYFPYMQYFMPFFLFLLGYSTIITYFCAGVKTAQYAFPRYGRQLYYVYTVTILFIFSFVETGQALIVMSVVQAALLALNLVGICKLRKEIEYDFDFEEAPLSVETAQAG
ncbi:MAG: sodium:alanine symporter family protein [Verrucomicrobia bacterium]|nr:sodium:alanine symporter family protein [Verrucomicrobiota bacterium]